MKLDIRRRFFGARFRAIRSVVISAAGLLFIWASPVRAYVDPGFGLFVGQAIVSAVLGVLFVGRSYVRRVVGRVFGRKKPAEALTDTEANAEPRAGADDAGAADASPDRKSRVG